VGRHASSSSGENAAKLVTNTMHHVFQVPHSLPFDIESLCLDIHLMVEVRLHRVQSLTHPVLDWFNVN